MTGAELKRRRKAAGLSQADLGALLGLSRDYVGLMERGRAPVVPRTAFRVSALGEESIEDPGPLRPRTRDPMERMVEHALHAAGLEYVTDQGGQNPAGLDFYLPQSDVHIEVKRFHSDRISDQMSRAPNVIAVQGEAAIRFFCDQLARRTLPETQTPQR